MQTFHYKKVKKYYQAQWKQSFKFDLMIWKDCRMFEYTVWLYAHFSYINQTKIESRQGLLKGGVIE